jgi:hypothetical protein
LIVGTTKRRPHSRRADLASEGIISYLLTGTIDYTRADALDVFDLAGNDAAAAARWRRLRGDLLAPFVHGHPGQRPAAWWKYDSPRDPEYVGTRDEVCSPDLRQRVGGSGRPMREVYPGVYFDPGSFGIPHCWQDVDPADPPLVESEPSYLRRHGLLEPGEAKRLGPEAFDPVPVTVGNEDSIRLHLPEAAEGATAEEYREQLRASIRRELGDGEDE